MKKKYIFQDLFKVSKNMNTIFPYFWNYDDEEGINIIRIFGLNRENKLIYVKVIDFTPYVYLELPNNIEWTESLTQLVVNNLERNISVNNKPIRKSLVYRKKLYYANVVFRQGERIEKEYPYLFLSFATNSARRNLQYVINKPIFITGLGNIKLKVHESSADPILQLCSLRKIQPSNWIKFEAIKGGTKEKESLCDFEYEVSYKSLSFSNFDGYVNPLILSFDIECNSTNINTMPDATRPDDKIFQISCVLFRIVDGVFEKYLLSLGSPAPIEGVEILTFRTEAELLVGYTEFIKKHKPNIICGYNIFKFDIPYMLDRARESMCTFDYDQQGYIIGRHGKEKNTKWESQAYGTQVFKFLDVDGILFIDLLLIVQRSYKLNTYTLKNVAEFFLPKTRKGDLSAKGIFKCYRLFTPKSLKLCGEYNVQDSVVVTELFKKLNVWHSLVASSNVYNIPMHSLFTQGQQIKVYSQVYKYCMSDRRVVEKDVYIPKETDRYMGAYVKEPVPGLYEYLVSLDFSSLYPSIIIRYNIDYSTLVLDESIPDSKCNILEFEEHYGCEHDKTTHTPKIKKENVLCNVCKYRFLKEPMGVIPTIIQTLLSERKKVKADMEKNQKKLENKELGENVRSELSILVAVLNQQQLALKVSANSMYGSFGVKKGYLPLMPCAKATTGMGRTNIMIAMNRLKDLGCDIVYGDTDSAYVKIKKCNSPSEYFDRAIKLEEEINKIFVKPMKMAFEGELFRKYLILAKKKYVAMLCNRAGEVCDKDGAPKKDGEDIGKYLFKRGVLLARRDNAKIIRDIFTWLITSIFTNKPKEDILFELVEKINELNCGGVVWKSKGDNGLCKTISSTYGINLENIKEEWDKYVGEYVFDYKNFVITKSIGDIKGYKVRELPSDPKKREKRLKDLRCTETEYVERALPAHVQLALKMRKRGKIVDIGERLEFVITRGEGIKDKQFNKIEDAEYFCNHKNVIDLDVLHYISLMIVPFDQVLSASFGVKNYVKNYYESCVRKYNIIQRLKKIKCKEIILKK